MLPIKATPESLGEIMRRVLEFAAGPSIETARWESGRYHPTPTIIEAAMALYGGHKVEEISKKDAGAENLAVTSNTVDEIIRASKANSRKSICFVTGVPGAGNRFSDSTFASSYDETFTPGAILSFQTDLTTAIDTGTGGTPDEFSFAILDGNGDELATSDPSTFDTIVTVDLNSATPIIQGYGSTNGAFGAVTTSAVPERVSFTLTGLCALGLLRRRKLASGHGMQRSLDPRSGDSPLHD